VLPEIIKDTRTRAALFYVPISQSMARILALVVIMNSSDVKARAFL
jgi:hypothetical protein